jgi:hypothetical protein
MQSPEADIKKMIELIKAMPEDMHLSRVMKFPAGHEIRTDFSCIYELFDGICEHLKISAPMRSKEEKVPC